MGADFAENTMDSLLQGGMTRSQAMNTMADPAFQEKVVAEIARLAGIDLTSVGALDQTLQTDNKPNSPGSIELPATPVNAEKAYSCSRNATIDGFDQPIHPGASISAGGCECVGGNGSGT
ncbi:hypothetical protein [Pseudomonas ficuserectae]|uniref:hypothetical protein n=1 Tax=Pseudomonas ficuserectae TaxID=53410 RepID=UPI0006D65008|nr:hypothetical protein [Pseudomonas ficuserectae]